MKMTPNFGKKAKTTEEHLEEEGASMPVQADKTTESNAGIVVKSATTKKNAERRSMSRLPHAEKSPITPPTPTMMTISECS